MFLGQVFNPFKRLYFVHISLDKWLESNQAMCIWKPLTNNMWYKLVNLSQWARFYKVYVMHNFHKEISTITTILSICVSKQRIRFDTLFLSAFLWNVLMWNAIKILISKKKTAHIFYTFLHRILVKFNQHVCSLCRTVPITEKSSLQYTYFLHDKAFAQKLTNQPIIILN